MPTMIYHVPFPLQPDGTSASQIRPAKMREAFKNIGYSVIEVSGYAKERSKKMRFLERKIRGGLKIDFVYSEAASIPTSFTEPKHFPLHMFLDRRFFRFLHNRNIPIGVFYRDVYWVFPEYTEVTGKAVAAVMRRLYIWDIATYNRFAKVLFLPSVKMAPFIPSLDAPRIIALPPGAPVRTDSDQPKDKNAPLRLLYVGNVGGSHYRISALLEALKDNPHASLKIVTRKEEWEKARSQYGELIGQNVAVVHETPDKLDPHYRNADIAMLFVEPQEYRDFAVPFKLFEYLGYGKPVIASDKTFAGDLISQSGSGWTIPYSSQALSDLLAQLIEEPETVAVATNKARELGAANSWENRAREVAAALTS